MHTQTGNANFSDERSEGPSELVNRAAVGADEFVAAVPGRLPLQNMTVAASESSPLGHYLVHQALQFLQVDCFLVDQLVHQALRLQVDRFLVDKALQHVQVNQ